MAKKLYKRRKYILGNTSQPKYIFSYFLLFFTGLAFFSILFSLMSMETTTITYYDNIVNIGNTPNMLLKKMLGSIWIILLVGGFFLFIYSIYLTHKVAGPAYRIEKSIEQMLKGEFGFKIVLRTKDEMKPIAAKLETLSFKILEKQQNISGYTSQIVNIIESSDIKEDIKQDILKKCVDIEAEVNN
jgi:hypothetical protein